MTQLKDAAGYQRRHRERKAVGELGKLLDPANPEKGQNKKKKKKIPKPHKSSGRGASELPLHGGIPPTHHCMRMTA